MRFRSTSHANLVLGSMVKQKNALAHLISDTGEIYQIITEAFDLATAVRKKIIGSELYGKRIMNRLIADRVALREQQAEELQRIQQLLYKLRRYKNHDVFFEVGQPLVDFPYRWVHLTIGQYDDHRAEANFQPRWTYEMLPLDPAEYKFNLKAADNGNEIATVITQSEGTFNQKNTIGNPASVVAVRGRDFSDGYIVTEIRLLPDASNSTINPGSAAGLVFKLQNDKEFGFVTLSTIPLQTQNGVMKGSHLIAGRVNSGTFVTFTPAPIAADLTKWSVLGLRFSPNRLSVFIDGLQAYDLGFSSPWVDGGMQRIAALKRIHVAASSASFRNFITGPKGSELVCGGFVATALGATAEQPAALTRPFSPEQYQAFLAKTRKASSVEANAKTGSVVSGSAEMNAKTPEQQNRAQHSESFGVCYDYAKSTPSLSDWSSEDLPAWSVIHDSLTESDRLTLASKVLAKTYHGLLLKNFACKKASLSVRIHMEQETQAGLILDNIDDKNRWLATIDSGFGTIQLTRVVNGTPTLEAVSPTATLQDSQLHKLETKEVVTAGKRQFQVWLNERLVLTHEEDESVLNSGNDNVKRSGGGYGIWIGRGVAEFADFKVLDVEPYS